MTDQGMPDRDTQISCTLGDLHDMIVHCIERTYELTSQNMELDDIISQVGREVAENMHPAEE